MNKKPIKLHIVSALSGFVGDTEQTEDDEINIDMTTDAVYCDGGDKIVIEYDELLSEENNITHTVLSFEKENPGTVFLTRSGDLHMTCVLEEKKRYRFLYDIGPASLECVAVGRKVRNSISEAAGGIKLNYDMEMRGMLMRRCDFEMTII